MEYNDLDVIAVALCLITETNREEEMPYVAGAITNRVTAHYRGQSAFEVVLAPFQFSRFNKVGHELPMERRALEHDDPAGQVLALVQHDRRYSEELYTRALGVAQGVLDGANPWADGTVDHPRASRVMHYFSPVSMHGAVPAWFDPGREVLVPAIDYQRFRWFADIR